MRTTIAAGMKWIIVVVMAASTAGCGWTESDSSNYLLDMVTPPNYELVSYYAEAKINYTYKDSNAKNVYENYKIKEWVDAKQGRHYREMEEGSKINYSLQLPGKMLFYTSGGLSAYTSSFSPDDPDMALGTRESFMKLLESIRKNYTIKSVEDEKFLGRSVQRLHAVAKDTSHGSEMVLWIDKETWMVLKYTDSTDDSLYVSEYTHFETRNKFKDEEFQLKLPEHVKVEELDEHSKPTKITLREAAAFLKNGLMFLPQSQDIKLSHVEKEVYTFGEDADWTLISLIYNKPDDTPLFQLYISSNSSETDTVINPGSEHNVKVRNKQGVYWEELQVLSWEENGYLYELMSRHPDLKQDDLVKWAEKLVAYPYQGELKIESK